MSNVGNKYVLRCWVCYRKSYTSYAEVHPDALFLVILFS